MLLVGLTGGIACGKSTVSLLLAREHNFTVIDADTVVRELQRPWMPCTLKIAKRWPECVDSKTGQLDRAALSNIIFGDQQARRELSRIMNFPIFLSITRSLLRMWWQSLRREIRGETPLIVVLDAPLLFESNIYTWFIDAAVVVACKREHQIRRLEKRNNLTQEEALQRICAQMPLDEKCKRADHVIYNDGSFAELEQSVNDSVEWMHKISGGRMTCIIVAFFVGSVTCLAAVAYSLFFNLLSSS